MRLIRITTDNEVSICEKEGMYTRDELAMLIGEDCEYAETVMPRRLYNELGIPKIEAVMLVDEDGRMRDKPMNVLGSWLYETDKHCTPIVGNVLITGFMQGNERNDVSDMKEEQLNHLYDFLMKIAKDIRRCRGE